MESEIDYPFFFKKKKNDYPTMHVELVGGTVW